MWGINGGSQMWPPRYVLPTVKPVVAQQRLAMLSKCHDSSQKRTILIVGNALSAGLRMIQYVVLFPVSFFSCMVLFCLSCSALPTEFCSCLHVSRLISKVNEQSISLGLTSNTLHFPDHVLFPAALFVQPWAASRRRTAGQSLAGNSRN